jgi:lon-related putative ATP-dependent protease
MALPAEALRWRCDPARFDFETTRDVEPIGAFVGQESAVDALRFGLATNAKGQNVFVRGLSGTGRMTLVKRLIDEIRPSCPEAPDRCYVRNFDQPSRPALITLPRGRGRALAKMMDEVADFIHSDLKEALDSEPMRAGRSALETETQRRIQDVSGPFEAELKKAGLGLTQVNVGNMVQTAIFPIIDGKPVPPDVYQHLRDSGRISPEQHEQTQQAIEAFTQQFEQIAQTIQQIHEEHEKRVRDLVRQQVRSILDRLLEPIRKHFPQERVQRFLAEVVTDLSEHRMAALHKGVDFTRLYRVNALVEHDASDACPVIDETSPTLRNLLGWIDQRVSPSGAVQTDHMMIRPGSILKADGGFLLLEARDLVTEPGAWKMLVRTLRCGKLEIVPTDLMTPFAAPTLKPEPIELNVKVILLGDSDLYYALDGLDSDFPQLFKVLADFDTVIERDDNGIAQYAGLLARVTGDENLPDFDRTAVAALVEHGARIAAQAGKLTARFSRLLDITREAAFVAQQRGDLVVSGDDVREAVKRTRRRADLPARKFRALMEKGTIQVQTEGEVVGQINGLAVISAGPLTYGFPQRITATIGPGTAGVINIEREADLSGAIHTKGFYILSGLLRHLLQTEHPLAFDASIAFEQSYGGIDGDSASGAEMCCLLSALTGVPIRQNIAMTGAIDQRGQVMAVGAVTEKIEGFFDHCQGAGLTGAQGVIIPHATAGDIMLRHDVVEASRDGKFNVFPVRTIHEALEILTGMEAGRRAPDGRYPEHTLLAEAMRRAHAYWKASQPARPHQ